MEMTKISKAFFKNILGLFQCLQSLAENFQVRTSVDIPLSSDCNPILEGRLVNDLKALVFRVGGGVVLAGAVAAGRALSVSDELGSSSGLRRQRV